MTDQHKTMTLNLPTAEMNAVEELAKQQDLSKTALIRQALRLYQFVNARLRCGEKMAWIGVDGKPVEQIMLGCGGHD